MEILAALEVTVYIDDVFIADDTEDEHLDKLQMVVERIIAAGLKLNLKKCQLGQFQVKYLGFQVSTDLGLSEGFREKLDQIRPPTSEKPGTEKPQKSEETTTPTDEWIIYTDSNYCAQALTEHLNIWEENGFESAKGKAVAHKDL